VRVELQNITKTQFQYVRPFTSMMRLSKGALSAMFLAGCLFIVTIYTFGYLSNLWVEKVYLLPGKVAAMGVNPMFDTFQGSILQKKAFQDQKILPLYGSSEMSYINKYQPAKIFTPETGFTPFLVGRGGTQTLIHVLNFTALGEEVRGRKLAIFLTPQWYGPGGIPQSTFEGNFSPLHAYEMLRDPELSSSLKQEIAKRILQFPGAYKDYPMLERMLTAETKPSWSSMLTRIIFGFPAQMEYAALSYQDAAKTEMNVNKLEAIPAQTSENLRLDWAKLRTDAIEDAKNSSNNNPFGMDNNFYLQYIKPKLQETKNSDKNATLFPSPEYEDLTLLMKVLKEKGANPLFVLIPMNGRWSDYTGFSRTERQACYQRLAQMIQNEGFQLADFTANEYEEYYLRDPWHLSWKGWIDVDEALDKFYRE